MGIVNKPPTQYSSAETGPETFAEGESIVDTSANPWKALEIINLLLNERRLTAIDLPVLSGNRSTTGMVTLLIDVITRYYIT